MHDEELAVISGIWLRRRRYLAALEGGNGLRNFFYAECDETMAQIAKRIASAGSRKFIASEDWTGVDSGIHKVNGDAARSVCKEGPLRAAHAAYFGEQSEMNVEYSQARDLEDGTPQDVAAGENN